LSKARRFLSLALNFVSEFFGYKNWTKKRECIKEKGMALKVGQTAPDFILKSHLDRDVRLSQYLGKKNIVLAFFPLAWTPV